MVTKYYDTATKSCGNLHISSKTKIKCHSFFHIRCHSLLQNTMLATVIKHSSYNLTQGGATSSYSLTQGWWLQFFFIQSGDSLSLFLKVATVFLFLSKWLQFNNAIVTFLSNHRPKLKAFWKQHHDWCILKAAPWLVNTRNWAGPSPYRRSKHLHVHHRCRLW